MPKQSEEELPFCEVDNLPFLNKVYEREYAYLKIRRTRYRIGNTDYGVDFVQTESIDHKGTGWFSKIKKFRKNSTRFKKRNISFDELINELSLHEDLFFDFLLYANYFKYN